MIVMTVRSITSLALGILDSTRKSVTDFIISIPASTLFLFTVTK